MAHQRDSSTGVAHVFRYVIYDTMTDRPYSGNSTPIFILDDSKPWPEDSILQTVSSEMNQAEHSFVRRDSGNTYTARWFTPIAEERFCGHGTVGIALALAEHTRSTSFTIKTKIGITISIEVAPPSNKGGPFTPAHVTMQFPEDAVTPGSVTDSTKRAFAEALGISVNDIVAIAENEIKDIIVELPPHRDFSARAMAIDPKAMLKASPPGTRSQVITSAGRGTRGADFFKRVFAFGGEDQATGSTYASLAPYWGAKLGKSNLVAEQISLRGGGAEMHWDAEKKTVSVVAKGVKVGQGEFWVPLRPPNAGSGFQAKL
ncbi:Diaminopimelate epimerase-like protein [Rhizodiscina lignyota]|uniref:Diaminopimelate epimerase-like protein n=1 Tax=Rhizodiscina lignyota TaxID=1504668 RepID=A0A9P4IV70_9PEZI|nr:Diaminopimelate epimerase-like protein [Rhizodiscina lignyota]